MSSARVNAEKNFFLRLVEVLRLKNMLSVKFYEKIITQYVVPSKYLLRRKACVHRITHLAAQISIRIRNFEDFGAELDHCRLRRRSEESGRGERAEISLVFEYGLEPADVCGRLSDGYVLWESIRDHWGYGWRGLGRLYGSGRGKIRTYALLIDGFEGFDCRQSTVF